ncbi:hypothetical protein [Vineibacter terrae]|uniref:hypothetical protein n=1 Tax=Vineibacter terrae TaxID=2586908 RepID=UPI002E34BD17|nr:hypothetical protein [Vineibacter terrae]HEX2891848.1 hypothetical protein [Vineibacter terrae]
MPDRPPHKRRVRFFEDHDPAARAREHELATTTVRQLAARGGLVQACCWRCHREKLLDPHDLMDRHADRMVKDIPVACTRCGAGGLPYTMIHWPSGTPSPGAQV